MNEENSENEKKIHSIKYFIEVFCFFFKIYLLFNKIQIKYKDYL